MGRIKMRHDEIHRIGSWIGRHIARHYPFRNPEEAAIAFLNFVPRRHTVSYEECLPDFVEPFLQAYICSCLERYPGTTFQSMIPAIKKHTLLDVRTALENNDYPLHFDDRDMIINLINDASAEFFETLEFIAARREDAKTFYTLVVSKPWKKKPLHRFQ